MSFYSALPASLAPIVQNGLLTGVFEEALTPLALYDMLAELRPWGGERGAQAIMTRPGMMPISTTAVTGQDAPLSGYGFEQYSMFMNQYGTSIDTNMAVSAMALASKFVEDNQKLGENAALSLNAQAQQMLYNAFGGGTTWATEATSASTTVTVADGAGFTQAYTFGPSVTGNTEGLNAAPSLVLAPVSSANPLSVTIGGTANTVTGVTFTSGTSGAATLTLGTAATAADGAAVISLQGPTQFRPNGRASANQLVAGDVVTLATFQSAVARLRAQNVPTIGGAYTAHVAPETITELFADPAFQSAYRGRADSPVYRNLALGRFAGIDWIDNSLTPTETNQAGVEVFRPIVAGRGCLVKGPFEKMGDLVSAENAGAFVHIEMIRGVARILRPALDRFGQVLSSTWSWIGGYAVGSDALMERGQPNSSTSSALYKRAVVIEHA